MQQTFLVEIGTEELPPKSLRILAESFSQALKKGLDNAQLSHQTITWYASPRRLALKVTELAATQPDTKVLKRGPAIHQAFDNNGNPTPAAKGWAKGCGIDINQAERLVTDKGEWLSYTFEQKGLSVSELLPQLISHALTQLPIPKPMRWGEKDTQFIRPVHTVTLLYGDTLIHGQILGINANRHIYGHRFMGKPVLTLEHADQYPRYLEEEGKVIADYQRRKMLIRQQIEHHAKQLNAVADLDENLLEEVTSLVEWPVALTAKFEKSFLQVPSEALVHTMKGDQKYFPVYDKQGKLLPHFIFIANIDSQDPSQIISGNEKVVRPRLADAAFFFKTDLKTRLEERLPLLEHVLFQQQLGTLLDKTKRIEALSGWIAEQIGADVNLAVRAGLLSKCDLMTNMVFEFTETQGIMGMHYARYDGENEQVAIALNEQYMPRFAGDTLPNSLIACSVALADKIDSLVGIFGIGQHPKGDKDPFALRRAAIGILRIVVEKDLPIDLQSLTEKANLQYGDRLSNQQVNDDVIDFVLGRFPAFYQDEGFGIDTIQSVMARRPTKPADFNRRIHAVSYFRTLDTAAVLASANKRVSNILAKINEPLSDTVMSDLLTEPAEIELAALINKLQETLIPLFAKGDYKTALSQLAQLQKPVDQFFEQIMVMVEDNKIRNNRLALLNQLRVLFLHVADISLLQS